MNPTFYGIVDKGLIKWADENALRLWLGSLEGKEIEAKVAKLGSQRSIQANRFYWSVIVETVADSTGHSAQEIHELFKSRFLKKTIELKGKIYEVVRSTTELTVDEFQEYIERCRALAGELGISIISDTEI